MDLVNDLRMTFNTTEISLPDSIQLLGDIKDKFNLPALTVEELRAFIKTEGNEVNQVRAYLCERIRQGLFSCSNCALHLSESFTQKVPGEGSLSSPIVLIGEGPGFDEDKLGRPFVGRAGQLLTTILSKLNIDRKKIYITNVIKCRPPQNRTPNQKEINSCLTNLELELFIINPKVIIALGAVPLRYFKPDGRIMRDRGKWINSQGYWIMPTVHPAYILRQEGKALRNIKWAVWADFNRAFDKARELVPEYSFK